MCFEWKNRFACGHVGFLKVERCPLLGTDCFGPDGSERYVDLAAPCYDCTARQHDPDPAARVKDPYRKGAAASSPSEDGAGSPEVVPNTK